MTPSLEGWSTKAKKAPSPHEVRLAPLDTNPIFQCLGENTLGIKLRFQMKCQAFFIFIQDIKDVNITTSL